MNHEEFFKLLKDKIWNYVTDKSGLNMFNCKAWEVEEEVDDILIKLIDKFVDMVKKE